MTDRDMNMPPSNRATGVTLLTFGGLAAAFGAASCCGLPFLLASLGLGSAWLTGVAVFAAPHRLVLLTLAATGLAAGGYLFWRQSRAAACTPNAICARPAFRGTIIVSLLLGLALLYLGYAFV